VLQSAPKKTASLIQSTFSWAHPGHCPPCSKKDRFSYSEHFCLDAHHPACSKNDRISHSEQFFFCVCLVVSGWALLQKRPHLSFRALFLGRTPSCVLQKRPLLLFGAHLNVHKTSAHTQTPMHAILHLTLLEVSLINLDFYCIATHCQLSHTHTQHNHAHTTHKTLRTCTACMLMHDAHGSTFIGC